MQTHGNKENNCPRQRNIQIYLPVMERKVKSAIHIYVLFFIKTMNVDLYISISITTDHPYCHYVIKKEQKKRSFLFKKIPISLTKISMMLRLKLLNGIRSMISHIICSFLYWLFFLGCFLCS